MTNFFKLSEEAQFEFAKYISERDNRPFDEVLAELRAAGEITRQRELELQERLRQEQEKAKEIFDSEEIQGPFFESGGKDPNEGKLTDFNDNQDLLDEIAKLKDKLKEIADQEPTFETKYNEFEENFKYFDSNGNEINPSDNNFNFNNNTEQIISSQQSQLIAKMQRDLFRDALSKGNFSELSSEEILEISKQKEDFDNAVESFRKIISNLQQNRDLDLQDIRKEINIVAGNNNLFKKANGRDNPYLKQQLIALNDKFQQRVTFWANEIKRKEAERDAFIRTRQAEIDSLEGKLYAYNKINDFREKIIADIQSFRDEEELSNTEILVLQELIKQGGQFITTALNFGVQLPQEDIRELQLAILEAIELQKDIPKEQIDFFNPKDKIDESIFEQENKDFFDGFEFDNPFSGFNEFFGGISEGITDFGTAIARAFNPPEDEMVSMFIKAAKAQQRAAAILGSEQ
jgi:hypothetical protein